MPDRIENLKLICSGGLNSNENHLDLSDNNPGSATKLINYEPSLYGGYRRINGFKTYHSVHGEVDDGNDTAEGKVLGVFVYKNDYDNTERVIACRKNVGATTYSFWMLSPIAGWSKMSGAPSPSTVDAQRTVDKVRAAQFNFGSGNQIIFVDGVNTPKVFNGQTWYDLALSGTGGASSPGGDQMIEAPSVVEVYKRHIFISGDTEAEGVVAHSAPNDPLTWTTAAAGGQLTVGTDVVQIKPFRENLFVFSNNAIQKVSVNAAEEFVVDNVTSNVGCIARDSVLEIGGDLIFLAPDGFRPVAGTSRIGDVELETISKNIQGAIVDLVENYDLSSMNGVVVRSKSQVRFFVGDDTAFTQDSLGILGGLTQVGSSISWEFGTTLGIRASCCTSGYINKQEVVLHGDYDGKVYRQEQGNSFNGQDIVSIYATPYLDFGDAGARKSIRKINTFVRAEGPMEMNLSLSYDWGDYTISKPANYTQASVGAPSVYGGRNIDYADANVLYGGSSKPVMTTDVQGSGMSLRATFVSVGQYDPFSIQGLVIEFTPAGRR